MNTFAIITSINYPTLAVSQFSQKAEIKTIVVADNKTPTDWVAANTQLLSVSEQLSLGYQITNYLPWNHYSRKNIGYIYAIKHGADIIYDTDDDNIPTEDWYIPDFSGRFSVLAENQSFINIYQYFSEDKIWPRGFPLLLLRNDYQESFTNLVMQPAQIGIWQGLADSDPDVDAIYRMTIGSECFFKKKEPIVLGRGTVCPFNSQNTFFQKEAYPLLYIPSSVSFRFCDILRGLVAQPILWAKGLKLGFTMATVFQKRNPHNFMNDFKSEISMYLNCEKVVSTVAANIKSNYSVKENLVTAYESLAKLKVVKRRELDIVTAWVKSIE